MARNTFATLGILAVLLLSLGAVSAAVGGVLIEIRTDLPDNVSPGNSYIVEVRAVNTNDVAILLEWVNTSSSFNTVWSSLEPNSTLENNSYNDYSATLSIPTDYTGSHLRYLKANVYDNSTGDFLGTIQKGFTANSTVNSATIPGCTDSTANNYNPTATENDGSCTYDSSENICTTGANVGDLEISIFEIDNLGTGDDEEWELLDEIEIEVEIENTHNDDDVDDVLVEIIIMDGTSINANDVTGDFEIVDEEIDLGRIKEDSEETAIFKISELPADLDEGTYYIYIKAYSEDDEENQCVAESGELNKDEYHEFEVIRENDPAVIVKEETLKITASCGSQVILPLNVYNLGSDKEDKVLVTLFNSELGLDKKIVIDDLKSGKRKEITFFFDMPKELSRDTYDIKVMTYFDYDDDEDELDILAYDEDSEEIDKDYSIRVEVLSCQAPAPSINANLASSTELGQELIVKTIITNNGENDNFIISIADYESWAELISITPQLASINKGEFTEVTIKLMPTESGTHSFRINTMVDGETYSQPISVPIKEKPSIFGELNDTMLYIIGGIALLLVLIFIVLIVRISKRTTKKEF